MTDVQLVSYQEFSPQTIGARIHDLAEEAKGDGVFEQRNIFGVSKRNSSTETSIETVINAVSAENIDPFVIIGNDEILGVGSIIKNLRLRRIRHGILPVRLSRKIQPFLSEEIGSLGSNVLAWVPRKYENEIVLGAAYKQLAETARSNGDMVWTIEPRMTSYYVTTAIKDADLTFVDYGKYDDGEISGPAFDDYGLYIG